MMAPSTSSPYLFIVSSNDKSKTALYLIEQREGLLIGGDGHLVLHRLVELVGAVGEVPEQH